jgi:hypothetical protein
MNTEEDVFVLRSKENILGFTFVYNGAENVLVISAKDSIYIYDVRNQ